MELILRINVYPDSLRKRIQNIQDTKSTGMLKFLKNHPFAVEAHFDSSVVFTFALPKEQLQHKIPSYLELDTLNDQWAFLAVAMVQTRHLRPAGFPKFFGNDFFLIGYRIFVRYTTRTGKRLRGLYIIKSETNRKKMQWLGNLFTHYNYSTTDIQDTGMGDIRSISSAASQFSVSFTKKEDPPLPHGSPFASWKEARRFAGPLPFTFTSLSENNSLLIVEGVRRNWKPYPVEVINFQIQIAEKFGLNNAILANAFIVENIPYRWEKGKTDL